METNTFPLVSHNGAHFSWAQISNSFCLRNLWEALGFGSKQAIFESLGRKWPNSLWENQCGGKNGYSNGIQGPAWNQESRSKESILTNVKQTLWSCSNVVRFFPNIYYILMKETSFQCAFCVDLERKKRGNLSSLRLVANVKEK